MHSFKINLEVIEKHLHIYEDRIALITSKINEISACDSFQEWLEYVITNDSGLASCLGLPTNEKTKKALLVLLSHDSTLKAPIIYLLSNRLDIYLSCIPALLNHSVAANEIKNINTKLSTLNSLLGKHRSLIYQRDINKVADALSKRRLHTYKDEWNNTDLRVVLKTLYENPNDKANPEKYQLFEFVINQLLVEDETPGHIPEPRHIWWAIEVLGSKSDNEWLEKNIELITSILKTLLSKKEYFPRRDLEHRTIAPELISVENEMLWEAINIYRILASKLNNIIDNETKHQMVQKFNDRYEQIIKEKENNTNFLNLCVRLLYFYECKKIFQSN